MKTEKLPLPQVIFITLDPKRDTAKAVNAYVKAFNPNFIELTEPSAGIHQLSKQMGVVYIQAEQSKTSDNNYQIDHSGALYLVNPEGKLAAIFSPPHEYLFFLNEHPFEINYLGFPSVIFWLFQVLNLLYVQ